MGGLMDTRQAAFGAFLAAVLVFGAGAASPASQADGQMSVSGAMGQLERQTEAVFDGLRHGRDVALNAVCDVFGALVAQAKRI
jgi:hypothetical protein